MSLLPAPIQAFLAIVRCGTVHGAAREVGITQTGVTQRIRSLERDLGVTLFTRSRTGMRLTAEGEVLHRYCQRVHDMEGELAASLRAESSDGSVRLVITGPSTVMRSRVIPQATRILEEYPRVALTFLLDDDQNGLRALKTGTAQLAVLPRAEVVAELDSKLLRSQRYALVACPAWRRRQLGDVVEHERIVDFNERDDATLAFLARGGLAAAARRDRHFANNIDALVAIVAGGHGYSVLADEFAAPLVAQGVLARLGTGIDFSVDYALAWYPRPEMPKYFLAATRAIK
jgi:LysR family transcriptional regulator, chromosome initiation inhibitor